MPDVFEITVETGELFAAFDAVMEGFAAHGKAASYETAQRVDNEATSRVVRRTGATAEGIIVEETHDGVGYVVLATNPNNPGVPGFLEHGTVYMTKRPFLFASAHLELGPHERRVSDATQEAIDAEGLGGE